MCKRVVLGICVTLCHQPMGDLHLIYPALKMSILDAAILIMVQQVSLIMFSLNMVDCSMSFLLFLAGIFFMDN